MRKAYVLTGLGFGDEGKGTAVHYLAHREKAHTVVRTGGAQALHSVITSDGREHTFSQFGSGTLTGAKTYLSRNMVMDPQLLWQESHDLEEMEITEALNLVRVDEDALVITPYHIVANRLKELARSERHSTVGRGIGEVVLDSESRPDEAIRARDFLGPSRITRKLVSVQHRKREEIREIEGDLPATEQVSELVGVFDDKEFFNAFLFFGQELARRGLVVPSDYLAEILEQDGVVIFEPSQGVLLDRWYGFHPFTTKVVTTPDAALDLIAEAGYEGEVVRLGITRAYMTRHGTGPFVSEDENMTRLLPDVHNQDNEWQLKFRVGAFDAVATRYAIEASGGTDVFDGLVVTNLDRLHDLSEWPLVTAYRHQIEKKIELERFFDISGPKITRIKAKANGQNDDQLIHQAELTKLLERCRPLVTSISREGSLTRAYQIFFERLREYLGVPIAINSFGPTEQDKWEVIPVSSSGRV